MAVLNIVYAPHPILAIPTRPVTTTTPEVRRLVQDMIETMYATGGVGLAANQVGQPWRLFVASADQARGRELVVLNPVIVSRRGRLRAEEGCLSLPGISSVIPRAATVRLVGMSLDGNPLTLGGHGLLARIFQHETDHLDGKLYVDRVSWLVRRRLLRRFHRQQRALASVRV